jgi:FkbM family methyltransferase
LDQGIPAVKPLIKIHWEEDPSAAALFDGLPPGGIAKASWTAPDGELGRFWMTVADDVHWISDGTERLAVLPERAFRFYNNGVAKRRNMLTDRYLRGIVPIQAGDVAINFGANVGEVAVTLAERGARVIAVEPDPNVLPTLAANAAGRMIEIVPVAAWNTGGMLLMYLKSDTADTSAFNVSDDTAMIKAARIDTLMETRGTDRIRLIVGDAEGAEPEVLEGARETLKRTDYVSVCASAERCGERTVEACEAILKDAGFDIVHREDSKFCVLIGKNALA